MKANVWSAQSPGGIAKAIAIILVLSFVLTYSPQPAQAACAFKYTVQSGDSLYGIAARYLVSFEDLVKANKLKEPYFIYVGQKLCMPKGAVQPTDVPLAPGVTPTAAVKLPTIVSLHMGEIAWVALANFPKNRIYYINGYPASRGYWAYPSTRLTMVTTDKTGTFTGGYIHLPKEFYNKYTITICAKDVITDDVVACQWVSNWDYWLERGGK